MVPTGEVDSKATQDCQGAEPAQSSGLRQAHSRCWAGGCHRPATERGRHSNQEHISRGWCDLSRKEPDATDSATAKSRSGSTMWIRPSFTVATTWAFTSTPITRWPAFASTAAVGRPIYPRPTTQQVVNCSQPPEASAGLQTTPTPVSVEDRQLQ